MDLDVNGAITPNPTPDDIVRAIASRRPAEDWSIVLDDGERGYLQGFAEAGQLFRLTARRGRTQLDGRKLVDAERLATLLTRFLQGDDAWRHALAADRRRGDRDALTLVTAAFDQLKAAQAGRPVRTAPGELSPLAVLGAIAVAGLCLVIAFNLDRLQGLLSHLPWPFDGETGQIILLVALVPIGIGLVVARSKLARVRRAAGWHATTGRVIASAVHTDRPGSSIRNPLYENRPAVRYAFEVAGRRFEGERIGFGADGGRANTAATLARYPVGSPVTVFYDPADPTEAVLEREAPQGLQGGCLRLAVIALFAVAVIAAIATTAPGWIAAHMPKARNPNLAILTGSMGIAALLLAVAYWRRISRAARWPAAPGKISFSGVEEVAAGADSSASRRRTWKAKVEYGYEVAGQHYVGRQITLGVAWSGSRQAAKAAADRYPVGAAVAVHYDPANPGDAALEHSMAVRLVPLLAGVALVAFALYLAGVY